MNKTIKTILILSIVILISLGTYYLYSRNANGVASTIIDDDSSSYLSKINIDGIKYDSLNNSDKRVFDIFKSNLNEEYKLNIPENDSYGTLGGFIVNTSKEIPQKGDQITIENFLFIIEEATNTKIEVVKMIISE